MATSGPPPFNFPREYYFPPFFTRQTNLTTHHAQLTKWSALVLSYCRHHRIFKLSLSGSSNNNNNNGGNGPASSSAGGQTTATTTTATNTPGADELFNNRKLGRRLSVADVKEVIEFMRRDGRAEYVGGGGGGDVVWIYWRTPEEWATLIEAWVEETAQKGSVLTLYELTEGEGTRRTGELFAFIGPKGGVAVGVFIFRVAMLTDGGIEFHGLDHELLQKALGILVKRGKAQVFGQEDSQGVKFF